MTVMFTDLYGSTSPAFSGVSKIETGQQQIGGRLVKGWFVYFEDPGKQALFYKQVRYALTSVSE